MAAVGGPAKRAAAFGRRQFGGRGQVVRQHRQRVVFDSGRVGFGCDITGSGHVV